MMRIRTDDQRRQSSIKELITPAREQLTFIERIHNAAARGKIVCILRLSTAIQKDLSFATIPQQREAAERLIRSVGLNVRDAEVIEAIGESGQHWANRPQVREVQRRASRGEITILVLPRHNRGGRSDRDTFDLIEGVADAEGFLLAERGIFDLSDPVQKATAKQQATLSQQEVEQRVKLNVELKLARARGREYRTPLPPPLLWVPWKEPAYLEALDSAGLSDWLDKIRAIPETSLACSRRVDPETREVVEYVPGPFPDADAFRSAQLRMQWYLETGSPIEVHKRVVEDSEYPADRRGFVPQFSQRRWSESLQVEWPPCELGSHDRWLKNPTNYGIYQYTSGRGKKMLKLNPARARAMPPTVFVPDAFPGWGTPDDYVRVAALGAHAPRPTLKYRDERGPRLPLDVRCSNPLEEGRVCGHLLTPFYDARRKRVAYRSTGCGFKSYQHGHPYAHTTGMNREELEGAIVTAVRWAFDADTTERALGSFDLRTSLVLEEFHRISAKMHDIERDMESAARSADAHAKAGRESRATKAREREAEHERLYLEQLSKRDALGRPEDVAALSKVEERRIRALALDVERLLSAASKHRSILWQLLGALDLKAWVRRLGAGTFEVDVEFPGDVILRQVVLTKRIMATQQQAAWAAARLADGAAAEDVATELNAAKVRPVPIPFTADRVINAAAAYRQRHPLPGLPPGAVRLDMLDAPVSLDPLRARPRR